MAIKFPRVLAAVQKRERSQWEIGDALIAECGPAAKNGVHDGSYAKIVACSEELLRRGHDYSVRCALL